jgi:hypothetical protein
MNDMNYLDLNLCNFSYKSEKVQIFLRKFFCSYGYENYLPNQDIINSDDIEKVPCISFKNKIIQVLFKFQYPANLTNSRILIHCSLGMSRSPAIAIMYLMKKIKISFELVSS